MSGVGEHVEAVVGHDAEVLQAHAELARQVDTGLHGNDVAGNERPLVAGNVVTVEPGIYLPGKFGMRLEDFGVVTDDGFDVFTNSTHDLVVI